MSSDSSSDSSRWLAGIELGDECDSSAESARAEADNIGPVSVSTGSYPYTLQHLAKASSPLKQDSRTSDASKSARREQLPCHQLNVHADQSKVSLTPAIGALANGSSPDECYCDSR